MDWLERKKVFSFAQPIVKILRSRSKASVATSTGAYPLRRRLINRRWKDNSEMTGRRALGLRAHQRARPRFLAVLPFNYGVPQAGPEDWPAPNAWNWASNRGRRVCIQNVPAVGTDIAISHLEPGSRAWVRNRPRLRFRSRPDA